MSRRAALPLRTRWAVVCAALVSASGAIAVVITTVATDRLLHSRTRGAVVGGPPPSMSGPPGQAGAGGLVTSLTGQPRPPGPQVVDGAAITRGVLHDVRLLGALVIVGLVLVAIGTARFLAGRMLRPVQRVTETARSVTSADDGRRIAYDGPTDELHELADTIDAMLDRVAATSAAQRHFVADASHELRTPLAAMAIEIDVALDDPEAGVADLREALGQARSSLRRSERLVHALLELARAGALQSSARHDLGEAAWRSIEALRRTRPDLVVEHSLGAAAVQGDPVLLDRLAGNLLENAARHGDPSEPVRVRSGTDGAQAWLVVENAGDDLTGMDVELLFDRFRRVDDARAATTGGAGLGLAIVRQVVQAHGGEAHASARPLGGLRVEVRLPAAGPAPGGTLEVSEVAPYPAGTKLA